MWISVKDKFPPMDNKYPEYKNSIDVIVHEKWNDIPFIGSYSFKYKKWYSDKTFVETDGNACVVDNISQDMIDYWMEIPKPPKEEVI